MQPATPKRGCFTDFTVPGVAALGPVHQAGGSTETPVMDYWDRNLVQKQDKKEDCEHCDTVESCCVTVVN